MTYCTSWGLYPRIRCNLIRFHKDDFLRQVLKRDNTFIPKGNSRSYGDCALNKNVIDVRPKNYFIDFNNKTGLLHVQAGVLLAEILEVFVPRGWFLKITPGTKFITIGGAIASDVHGKNHHIDGCFSSCVKEFRIMLPDGEVVTCTKDKNPDLWNATCGGMGLTGVILDAKIYLKRIHSCYIHQKTYKADNLLETFELFEANRQAPYSVAWIDCISKGKALGRSLVMVGDFLDNGNLELPSKYQLSIPFYLPRATLNKWFIKTFNLLYYHKHHTKISQKKVDLDTFFYPLDTIGHWNRIYGKKGFLQYQFILPKEASFHGLKEILTTLSKAKKSPFLGVLKLYGPANSNWLSFPLEGYSMALDLKIERGIFKLLNRLDQIVLRHHGRLYLTKDARMSRQTVDAGYPNIHRFRELRKDYNMNKKFQSLQSRRLDI